jgi:uncharacterized damage-inducible protein DinB
MDDLRYPLGRYAWPDAVAPGQRAAWIEEVAAAPAALRAAVDGLSDAQLDTPYRPGGWTVRQLAHHVPDSHLNAYARFKLALTEDAPTIKPYDEARWAELPDSAGPLGPSLALLDAVHVRWVTILRAMPEEAWARTFVHPEHNRAMRLDAVLGLYAWHGRHHVAHVTRLREREGW